MKRFLAIFSILFLVCPPSKADEGMWMTDGLRSDAISSVVAIDFFGTGSVISEQGLIITNHHVAYSDICDASTPERNILKNGFWAYTAAQEIPVPGRKVFFLKEFRDVTAEVLAFRDSLEREGGVRVGSRRLAYLIEKKYGQKTGLTASLDAMWAEEKFYLSLYEVYGDVRLVGAPPECIGAFGGDTDNWQWPQHKCDFALYRIYCSPDGSPAEYSEANVPLHTAHHLKISSRGYKMGDKALVIGYPGRTDRYSSSQKTDYKQNLLLPINNAARSENLAIIKKWMAADEGIRLKYSDAFFSLSNVTECEQGEQKCLRQYQIIDKKRDIETDLQRWIDEDPLRKGQWGHLLPDLDSLYAQTAFVEENKAWFRETMFRGPMIWPVIMRIANSKDYDKALGYLQKGREQTDPRVEKELVELAVRQYYTHVDPTFWGPYQRELAGQFGNDYATLSAHLWEGSVFSSTDALPGSLKEFLSDPLLRFQQDVKITAFNERDDNLALRGEIARLSREYTHALYRMKDTWGIRQYPDANSTMRYSTGKVCRLSPADGVQYDFRSTSKGIQEKHLSGKAEYSVSEEFVEAVSKYNEGINFLTDNDITGGNSGSPVLNRHSELIGLAFDGNTESLDSEMYYTAQYNRCVCVDIRYVLWLLKDYARVQRIIDELNI